MRRMSSRPHPRGGCRRWRACASVCGPVRRSRDVAPAVLATSIGADGRTAVRSALVAAVRGSGAGRAGRRALAPITMSGSRLPGSIRRARFSTMSRSIVSRRPYAGASVDRRDQAIPGFSERPASHHDVSRRLRCLLGDRRVRPRPLAVRAAAANAESFEAEARRCARERRGGGGAQLFRAARSPAAARGRDRSLLNQRETLRLTQVRRDAGYR